MVQRVDNPKRTCLDRIYEEELEEMATPKSRSPSPLPKSVKIKDGGSKKINPKKKKIGLKGAYIRNQNPRFNLDCSIKIEYLIAIRYNGFN